MAPSEFWAHSDEDQAYMIAYTEAISKMRAVEDEETRKEAENATS